MDTEGIVLTYSEQRHFETCHRCRGSGRLRAEAIDIILNRMNLNEMFNAVWLSDVTGYDAWEYDCPGCSGTGKSF